MFHACNHHLVLCFLNAMANALLFRDLSGPVPNQSEPKSFWDSVPIPIGVPGSRSRCETR